jgi:hypothetical protein
MEVAASKQCAARLPITITSLLKGQLPDSLEVPLQEKFEAQSTRVISSEEASVHPHSVSSLLEDLNAVLGTTYTLKQYPTLGVVLQAYIDKGYDFGRIYAHLRAGWERHDNPEVGLRQLAQRELEDIKMRSNAIDPERNVIITPNIPPRRVWDLYSNRVVPYWAVTRLQGAVSHSWMDIEYRQLVKTPINGEEWDVPIPRDTTLERVRVELLNLGMEYVWLDALCLRQANPEDSEEKKNIRKQEWKLDVPTIGDIYHSTTIVIYYYSGLGRTFRIGNLDAKRHWLNRAWTLQEVSANPIIAGVAADSPLLSHIRVDSETEQIVDPTERRFYDALGSMAMYTQDQYSIFPSLAAMRHRSAESELDKIAGLAYRIRAHVLPPYIPGQDPDEAWDALVKVMLPRFRGDLLFRFPLPGKGAYSWYPSWRQIEGISSLPLDSSMYEPIDLDESTARYHHKGYRFDDCNLSDLIPDDNSLRPTLRTTAQVIPGDINLNLFTRFPQTIAAGSYTLVAAAGFEKWLVGKPTKEGQIWKIAVLNMDPVRFQVFS